MRIWLESFWRCSGAIVRRRGHTEGYQETKTFDVEGWLAPEPERQEMVVVVMMVVKGEKRKKGGTTVTKSLRALAYL